MQALSLSRSSGARRAPSLFGFVARLREARALARQRAALARLDDAMLADIGLTRDEAAREASRSAWDAPRRWTTC